MQRLWVLGGGGGTSRGGEGGGGGRGLVFGKGGGGGKEGGGGGGGGVGNIWTAEDNQNELLLLRVKIINLKYKQWTFITKVLFIHQLMDQWVVLKKQY